MTEAEAEYGEPTLGVTHCTNPEVLFFAGIGDNTHGLGQDGTWAGGSTGLHQVFFEVLPANASFPGVTAPAGAYVEANVRYQGNDKYSFDINISGVNHSYSGTGGYDGSVVEAIVERPEGGSSFTPLLNFKSVTIQGLTGQSLDPLKPTYTWSMTGYATTGAISYGQFYCYPHELQRLAGEPHQLTHAYESSSAGCEKPWASDDANGLLADQDHSRRPPHIG